MACISKISQAINYDCDSGNTGIISALIINKEDIASFTIDPENQTQAAITLKSGASAFKIDTPKRTLVTTESLKINEGAPNAYTHTGTVVVTAAVFTYLFSGLINPVANGSFVILTKTLRLSSSYAPSAVARPFGLYYGMSATAVDRSSHENGGWFTISMATPGRVIGEDALYLNIVNYEALYSAAVG